MSSSTLTAAAAGWLTIIDRDRLGDFRQTLASERAEISAEENLAYQRWERGQCPERTMLARDFAAMVRVPLPEATAAMRSAMGEAPGDAICRRIIAYAEALEPRADGPPRLDRPAAPTSAPRRRGRVA